MFSNTDDLSYFAREFDGNPVKNHGAVCNTHDAANAQLFDTWTDLYDGINNANVLLDNIGAQQEYNRLVKLEQDLQELSNKLQNGLMEENNKNSLQFRDSINAFLKEYNKTHGYSLIFSNTGFDNLLYADSTFNITKEIVDGLNARYSPVKK